MGEGGGGLMAGEGKIVEGGNEVRGAAAAGGGGQAHGHEDGSRNEKKR